MATLPGIYLWPESETDEFAARLAFFGDVESALTNHDLAHYGSSPEDKVVHWFKYLDATLGAWLLGVVAQRYDA